MVITKFSPPVLINWNVDECKGGNICVGRQSVSWGVGLLAIRRIMAGFTSHCQWIMSSCNQGTSFHPVCVPSAVVIDLILTCIHNLRLPSVVTPELSLGLQYLVHYQASTYHTWYLTLIQSSL